MKYTFIGKPDHIFPHLKTGKVYEIKFDYSRARPTIITPVKCPYSSWDSFYRNWRPKLIK